MAISPSPTVQRARRELAGRLRALRIEAGLTARALSAAAGWHESKTSRIESANQAPTGTDIEIWCRTCGASHEAGDLVAASRAADSMYVEWRRMHRTGLRRSQESARPLHERTRLFQVYCSTVVPGFLQTPEYASALLSAITAFRRTPDDVAAAVQARISRNDILHADGHSFALLVEESVLRYRLGTPEVMAAQLRHVLGIMALPSVSLGVIPFSRSREMWTVEAFSIFDDTRVHVELVSALLSITAPGEVKIYAQAFGELAKLAVYGKQAQVLIADAIDALK